jgi:hypothetical protein
MKYSPYQDHWGLLDSFSKHIKDCVDLHRDRDTKDLYMGPYTSVLQSSGKGKSRLMLEYAKKELVLYVCFGVSPRSSYPPRNTTALNSISLVRSEYEMRGNLCKLFNLVMNKAYELLQEDRFQKIWE